MSIVESMSPKERPILFSSAMVRAILHGCKTQTRRPVTPQPDGDSIVCDPDDAKWYVDGGSWIRSCPYGVPSDRLWVRETWNTDKQGRVIYAADSGWDDPMEEPDRPAWRPSIFMRRSQSRITLVVDAVRIERLQALTEGDAQAEGVGPEFEADFSVLRGGSIPPSTHRLGFKHLWDRINGKRASWASNPWVWVVSFHRVKP